MRLGFALAALVALIVARRRGGARTTTSSSANSSCRRTARSCHAIGRSGDSPNKDAPAFRTLGQRYPVDSLEEALGEGILSGHPGHAGIQV